MQCSAYNNLYTTAADIFQVNITNLHTKGLITKIVAAREMLVSHARVVMLTGPGGHPGYQKLQVSARRMSMTHLSAHVVLPVTH